MSLKLLRGHFGTVVFALTTKCNCRCLMCGMHKNPPHSMEFKDVEKALQILSRNGFSAIYFTGGEPTLHPDIVEVIKFADMLGFATSLTTNGTSAEKTIERLKGAGLRLLSVSLDHWDPTVCEKIRGVKGIMQKQEKIIRYAKRIGLRVYALVYLSPFLVEDGVEKIVEYVNSKLETPVGFCYPTRSEVNTFRLYGDFNRDTFNKKLEESVRKIFSLKKSGFRITNAGTYLEDVLGFCSSPNFYCKGGEKVIYLDWFGDVYPCFLRNKLFNVLRDEKPRFLKNVACNECYINCFREPSILYQILRSPLLLTKEAAYSYPVRRTIL